jgi:hypothetical protein
MKIAIVLAFASLLSWSQEPPATGSKPPLATAQLEKGDVLGGTYKNIFFGVELTPASNLKFSKPELTGNTLRVTALGKFIPHSAREMTSFAAMPLTSCPEGSHSSDACMQGVVKANQKDGFEETADVSGGLLGGISFLRRDFSHHKLPAYEAVFLKACDTNLLLFVFSSSGKDAVDKLIAETDLKLDLAHSGCMSGN